VAVPRFTIELSAAELDVVWRALSFGDLPLILDVPSPGATQAERAALEARVWAELVDRELAEDHGRATGKLVNVLGVIRHRRWAVELRTFGPDPRRAMLAVHGVRAMLAVHGVRAVLAVLDDEKLRLARVPDTGIAGTLLSLLPELPAGTGHQVTVAAEALTAAAAAGTSAAARDVLRGHGVNRDDAGSLVTMTTGGIRTGQIAAEHRGPDGRLIRSPRIVAFYDTPHGRYRALRTDGHLTIGPATLAALAYSVDDLLLELRTR
jgi:hypothetical protein